MTVCCEGLLRQVLHIPIYPYITHMDAANLSTQQLACFLISHTQDIACDMHELATYIAEIAPTCGNAYADAGAWGTCVCVFMCVCVCVCVCV